jgi:small subunit ribosomal protein S8
MNDLISDMFARINNAQKVLKSSVLVKRSKLSVSILKVLRNEGFIRGFTFTEADPYSIEVLLKYFKDKPVISYIKRISKPGRRIYMPVATLWKTSNGLEVYIISTTQGILTDYQARKLNLGGEIICKIL